jgi:hypothetical protein
MSVTITYGTGPGTGMGTGMDLVMGPGMGAEAGGADEYRAGIF